MKQISEVEEKLFTSSLITYPDSSAGNLSPAMGAMNPVGMGNGDVVQARQLM
jgi:hypothetical protein